MPPTARDAAIVMQKADETIAIKVDETTPGRREYGFF